VAAWTPFFATCGGSAATLAGLTFVATQLHLDTFTDPSNRWTALAQSTLTLLSSVLGLSLAFLMPTLPLQVRSELTMGVSALVLWRTVRIWLPVMRLGESGRLRRLEQSFWLLLAPLVAYAYLLTGAIMLLLGDQNDGLVTVAGAFLTIIALSLRNSWRLVSVARRG
jgi:cytochrome bd-type quinol oxidase subunit 2